MPCHELFPFEFDRSGGHSVRGLLGGAQIGADYAAGNFLLGVLGDFSATDINGKGDIGLVRLDHGRYSFDLASGSASTDIDWMATVRGRVGVIGPLSTLLYVTGGLAAADVESTFDYHVLHDKGSFSNSDTRFGWTVGAAAAAAGQ